MKTSDETMVHENETGGQGETIKSLYDLLIAGLKSVYWTEKELTNAIFKMSEKVTSDRLQSALLKHLAETKTHVKHLEEIFVDMEHEAEAKKCETISGVIKDGEEMIKNTTPGNVRDAAIILVGQKMAHLKIATYGALISYAHIVGENVVAGDLQIMLDEEKAADTKLTEVSELINVEADTSKENTSPKIAY